MVDEDRDDEGCFDALPEAVIQQLNVDTEKEFDSIAEYHEQVGG